MSKNTPYTIVRVYCDQDGLLAYIYEDDAVYRVTILKGRALCSCTLGRLCVVFACSHIRCILKQPSRWSTRLTHTEFLQALKTFRVNWVTSCALEEECAVCLNALSANETAQCPVCLQWIHAKCIKEWLAIKEICVYCRSPIWAAYQKHPRLFQPFVPRSP